jgi:hypothetical protein
MYISWQNVPLVEWILFHSRHDLQIARHVSSHAALPCTVHISGPNTDAYTLFIHVSLINLERRFSKADLHSVFNMMDPNWCYFYMHLTKNRTKDIYSTVESKVDHYMSSSYFPIVRGDYRSCRPTVELRKFAACYSRYTGSHPKTALKNTSTGNIYAALPWSIGISMDRWKYTLLFHTTLVLSDRWQETLIFHAALM